MQETQDQVLGQEDPPGEGNGNPLQYSCLENPMDRGAWRATAHGLAELDRTERLTLSLFTSTKLVKPLTDVLCSASDQGWGLEEAQTGIFP